MMPTLDASWSSANDDWHPMFRERDRLCIAKGMLEGVFMSVMMWLVILIIMP